MNKNFNERFKQFKQEWGERLKEISSSQLSPKQCYNIHNQFIEEFFSLVEACNQIFDSETRYKYESTISDLLLALEKAKSKYKVNYKPWYEKIVESLQVDFFRTK